MQAYSKQPQNAARSFSKVSLNLAEVYFYTDFIVEYFLVIIQPLTMSLAPVFILNGIVLKG